MSKVLRSLTGWEAETLPSLTDLGGEDLILREREEIISDPRNTTVLAVICQQWSELRDRAATISYVTDTVRGSHAMVLVDVLDVILGSPNALPDLAAPLAEVLSELSQRTGIGGAVAVEGWTRLALGNWCPSLELRAGLAGRAAREQAPDDGVFLVRAIGAALERWRDQELLTALTGLAQHEEIEDDAAYEMGMHHLNIALTSTDRRTALGDLGDTLRWLRLAGGAEQRPDAYAFSLAIEQLIRFAAGNAITSESVRAVESAVVSYTRAYLNEARHWRQPRADSAACWANLTQAMYEAADLHESPWWEPRRLLTAAARVLDAHRSLVLIGYPDIQSKAVPPSTSAVPAGASRQAGIELILRPPVQQALGSREENIALVDRWLEDIGADSCVPATAIAAVAEVREALRREVSEDPKGAPLSVPALRRMLGLDDAAMAKLSPLGAHPEILERLEAYAVLQEDQPGPTVAESLLLSDLLPRLQAIQGYSDVSPQVDWMVRQLARFVMQHIDKQGGSKRAEPWQAPFTQRSKAPTEDMLADSLARWLTATTGVRAHVEIPDIGGGRVDVIVFFQRLRLVIEVKREFELLSQDALVGAYGFQAAQYAAADVPFTFLAVLDLARRTVRADIQSCLWVSHVTLPSPGSRTYALTTARIQANLEPPSAASWGVTKPIRPAPASS